MFGMGMGELLLILVVALLVVGPDKLPQAARTIGKGIRDFRKTTRDLQSTIEQDEKLGEAMRELRSALNDDPLRSWTPPRQSAGPTGSGSGSRSVSASGTPGSGAEPGSALDSGSGLKAESDSVVAAGAPAVFPAAGTVAKQAGARPLAPPPSGGPAREPGGAADARPDSGSEASPGPKADDSAHG